MNRPYMDPASTAELRDFLASSNTHMERQEEQMMATGRAVQALVTQVSVHEPWTAIFRSLQRCSIGFKSGLWLGHSRTVTELL